MFAYVLILILILPFTFLASAVESLFTTEELTEMGIRLQESQIS